MSVADDIQTIVSDLSAAIAGKKTYGRTELEQLRRQLSTAAGDIRRGEAGGTVQRVVIDGVLEAIDRGVVDLAGVAQRTRDQLGLSGKAVRP